MIADTIFFKANTGGASGASDSSTLPVSPIARANVKRGKDAFKFKKTYIAAAAACFVAFVGILALSTDSISAPDIVDASQGASSASSNTVADTASSGSSLGGNSSSASNGSGNGSNFDTYDNPAQQQTTATYVLNTDTMKIHLPTCRDVKKIAPQNYATTNESIQELLNRNYTRCGHCKP